MCQRKKLAGSLARSVEDGKSSLRLKLDSFLEPERIKLRIVLRGLNRLRQPLIEQLFEQVRALRLPMAARAAPSDYPIRFDMQPHIGV
jgi:hypothetical protein